jgi:hypothetical protein
MICKFFYENRYLFYVTHLYIDYDVYFGFLLLEFCPSLDQIMGSPLVMSPHIR